MRKQKRTPEEEKAHKEKITFTRRFSGFVRSIKSDIEKNGLRSMELKLEFLLEHKNTPLPKPYFDHEDTMAAIRQGIKEYKESLSMAA